MSSYRLDFSEIGIDIHTKYKFFLHDRDQVLDIIFCGEKNNSLV